MKRKPCSCGINFGRTIPFKEEKSKINETECWYGKSGGFLLGAFIGASAAAITALLFAPKSGKNYVKI